MGFPFFQGSKQKDEARIKFSWKKYYLHHKRRHYTSDLNNFEIYPQRLSKYFPQFPVFYYSFK